MRLLVKSSNMEQRPVELDVDEDERCRNRCNITLFKLTRDVITPDLSKQLIAMFEESEHQHEEIQLEGHRSFTQVTLQNHTEWKPFAETVK